MIRDPNVKDSQGRWFRIVCEAEFPSSSERKRFVSAPMPQDPAQRLAQGGLMVRLDPADPANYAVILL